MRLKYQTGTGTLIQLIVLGLLNIATGLQSIIATCHHDSTNCISNTLTSAIFYILTVGWYAVLVVIGAGAQERRSRRLAQLLICAEALTALVALFNIKLGAHYHNGFLSLITSFADLVLSIWIITLAWRLMRAGPARVVNRPRQRKTYE
jgi:purine-cytosine permease-like protein